MLKSIHLQNWESHRNTYIEFSTKVNVLLGESESGKSSILRAILWIATNRPLGDDFRSHWGGDTTVVIETDRARVTRIKGKENKYVVELPDDQKPLELKAIGSEVPKQVTDALGLSALNFQTQFDPHFLLPPVSPGEVAKKLNEAINLEVIDRAHANINAMIRENRGALANAKAQSQAGEVALGELNWVKEAEAALGPLESLHLKTEQARTNEMRFNATILRAEEIDRVAAKLSYLPKAEAALKGMLSLLSERSALWIKIGRLGDIISQLAETKTRITGLRAELLSSEAEFRQIFPDICPLCKRKM